MSAAPVIQGQLTLTLKVTKGYNLGQVFSFQKKKILIGRGPENDIVLGLDVKVSRQHVEVRWEGEQVWIKNLSLKNPIAVSGRKIDEAAIQSGDVLYLGDTELSLDFHAPTPSPSGLNAVTTPNVQLNQLRTAGPVPATAQSPRPQSTGVQNWRPGSPTGFTPSPGASDRFVGQGSGMATAQPSKPPSSMIFKIVVGAVVLGGLWLFMSDGTSSKKATTPLRDSVVTQAQITQSENELEKFQESVRKRGEDTIQYRLAQEQYLRGFRDYRQGQFLRAMEQFQAALSLYPGHELARKYYTLAKRRFDEEVQFHMIQAKRYYGIGNFRLCRAHYGNVLKMKKDERDPLRREALQYFKECEARMEGKF